MIVERVGPEEGERAVEHVELDEAPSPPAGLGVEGGGDGLGGGDRRDLVAGERLDELGGAGGGVFLGIGEAGDRLDHRVVHAAGGVGSCVPETGHRDIDEARVDGTQGFVAEAQFRNGAGAEVLDEDIGLSHKVEQDRMALGRLEVQDDRALVAVDGCEHGRHAVALGAEIADQIAGAGPLDLDHVRALVGQDLGGHGA